MRKTSRRKKNYGFMNRNRPNPKDYAEALIKQHTAPEAFKLASKALDCVRKGKSGHIMEFCSERELTRNEGFWQSVKGFVGKRQ